MAKFLILIYGSEQAWDAMSPDELRQLDEGHRAFVARVGDGLIGGGALDSTPRSVSLRGLADGRPTATDGPFLETKEVLAGFFVVEAPDLDTAIAVGRLLPIMDGAVEVRPLA